MQKNWVIIIEECDTCGKLDNYKVVETHEGMNTALLSAKKLADRMRNYYLGAFAEVCTELCGNIEFYYDTKHEKFEYTFKDWWGRIHKVVLTRA